jgi:hypothetical protein
MDGQNVLRSAQGQTYSAEFLNRLSQAKTGQVVVGEDVRLGFVVAKLTAIRPPEPAAIAPLIVGARSQVSKSLFDDLGQATRSAARIEIKPHVDYVRARQALGVTAPSQGQSR